MVELNNGRPARILSAPEQEELDRRNDARRAALGRILAAYVLHTADPSDQHALDLQNAERAYLDAALRVREITGD